VASGFSRKEEKMKATIDHIGIAVADLSRAFEFFRDTLGLEVEAAEEVASQRVRAHFIRLADDGGPGATFEFLEPTSEDSPVAKFVAKRGAGMHHVALRVDDIDAALAELKAKGVRLIDEVPRRGAHGALIAFLHPASTHGVLVELKQRA
jgi:methylmalonyl-CoA/ethylmalonyl-CoA epimerase